MAVTAAVIENIDVLFVQRFLSDYETGLFAGAWRIAMLILLIGYSLGTVLNPRVSRYKSYADKRAYVQKALLLMGALVIAFLVSVPILPWIVSLTIGPQYLPSVPVLVPLIAAAFLSVATVPLAALFYQFQAAWYFSVTAAVQLSIILVGNWFWVPTGGLMAAGLTRLTAQATAFALTVIVAAYYLQRAHKTQS
jgi:O-antigen/teichoic acid export membrane protein